MKQELKRKDLVYPDLSFQIFGVIFEVFKELGPGFQEKYYQRAVARELKNRGLSFEEQVSLPLQYKDEKIGRYFLDFLIEKVIVLEIKKNQSISQKSIEQVMGYLKAFDLKLGLIANFTASGARVKRIVNVV